MAAISQDNTEWRYDDNTEGTGTVTAEGLTAAGIWDGVFNFNIAFVDTECAENEHDWEYETEMQKQKVKVEDGYDEEKPYTVVVICNQCGMDIQQWV